MNTILKTLVLAAAGAALIAASPASAQTHKRAANRTVAPAPLMLEVAPSTLGLWQNGETTVNGADTFGQIRGEYLKDAPTHNGNSY